MEPEHLLIYSVMMLFIVLILRRIITNEFVRYFPYTTFTLLWACSMGALALIIGAFRIYNG